MRNRCELGNWFLAAMFVLLKAHSVMLAADVGPVEIIAHRGASHDAPENTLESFRLAWEQNADAVELDIMLSRDGQIVVIHDSNTKRLGAVDRPVVEQSFDELRALDVGKWKDPRWTGARIPRLREVLQTIPDGKRLFIEIKCGPEIIPELKNDLAQSGKDLLKKVSGTLEAPEKLRENWVPESSRHLFQQAGKLPPQMVLIGFSAKTMEAAKKELPHLQAYWIVDIKKNPSTANQPWTAEDLIQTARSAGVDGLDLSAHTTIDRDFAKKILDAGFKLAVWTVNDPKVARQMIDVGVQGITTDRPGWMREQLRQTEK